MNNDDTDDGFFDRWSRRKRQAEAALPGVSPDVHPAPSAAPAPGPDAGSETLSDEDLAALPRIDDLTAGSDITGFLRPGVPPALKNAALRRIWMATPGIRDYCDPAVDYAWDWNTPGGVPGDGIAPAPEIAARMLRDFLAPRAGTEPQAPDATDPASSVSQAKDPVRTDDVASSAPGREAVSSAPGREGIPSAPGRGDADDPARPAAISAANTLQPAPSKAPSVPPRQRHGGALPG